MGAVGSKKTFTNFGKEANYTTLMLGQTGSGKTSLLNLIANFEGVLDLLFADQKILTEEELRKFGERRVSDCSLENDLDDPMASKTSDAKVYQVQLATNWHFTIIDTPGFGDSRGLEEDKKHVDRTMACLQKVTTINCIVLVMNGRDSRMTATMKYALTQITAVMPQSVLDHVVVVFTNTENKKKLTFKPQSLTSFLSKEPPYQCVDNPFGQVCDTLGDGFEESDREDFTKDIRKALQSMEEFGWKVHGLPPVASTRFAELNEKREEIEALLANNLEKMSQHDELMGDLRRHHESMQHRETVEPLTRQVQKWQLVRSMFDWSHYVCHKPDCHCNCHKSKLLSPFASLWCYFQADATCSLCHHPYSMHRVSFDGWRVQNVTETVDLGKDLEEAQRLLEQRIVEAAHEKQLLSQQLEDALDAYAKLGLRDAYVHLLRSQIAVLQERLSAKPDDRTLRGFLQNVVASLEEIEKAKDVTCCVCFENLANTELNCGHKQFCFDCSNSFGTCPLCRKIVNSRKLVSPTASTAALSSLSSQS